MSELDPLNPGQILKAQREKMGLSINDIAIATKINPKILKALEDGQKEVLPPRSFVRGFIRSYANYLKLKPEPILEAFEMGEAQLSATSPTQDNNEPSPAKSTRSDVTRLEQSSRVATIMVAVGIVVLIVLIFGVKSVMDKYASERVVDKPAIEDSSGDDNDSNPSDDTPADTEAKSDDAAVAPASETPEKSEAAAQVPPQPASDTKVDAKAVEAKAAEAKAEADKKAAAEKAAHEKVEADKKAAVEKKAADEKAAAEKVAAEKKAEADKKAAEVKAAADKKAADAKIAADKKAADAKEVADAKALAATDTKPASVKPGNPQEVIIEALDDVQITITVDGGSSKKISLKPDSVYTVKAKSDVALEVSDGGLVNIIYNGTDKGNPGTLGKTAKVKYP